MRGGDDDAAGRLRGWAARSSAGGLRADRRKTSDLNKKNAEPDTTAAPRFRSEVNLVTVDTAVLDNKGNFIPGIPPGNFRVLEDNVPQKIEKVDMGQAPITVALLIEFSNKFQSYWGPVWYQTLQLAYGFANTLQPQDFCAVIAYDMKPEILADFTTDRQKVQSALDEMRMATWSEANLYDALIDTTERMSGIDGRKAIVLISSGVDTFSKTTFDETRKALQQNGVPIYAIGLMQALRIMSESRMGQSQQMDFLMADNQMRTFASESGGQSFFPRFQGEFPSIFQAVHQALRLQYVITYTSSNKAHDGAFRKIKVELVNPATNEQLPMKDDQVRHRRQERLQGPAGRGIAPRKASPRRRARRLSPLRPVVKISILRCSKAMQDR